MKKIYTIRDLSNQQFHMWEDLEIEGELKACEDRNIKDIFKKYLQLPSGNNKEILEAGCGLGAWVIYLTRKGYNIRGIDHDEKVLERVKSFDNNLKVEKGDITNLNIEDESISAYISLGVLEHFEEGADAAINEAHRVLEKNGIAIVTVPYNNIFRLLVTNHVRAMYLFLKRIKGHKMHFAEYRYNFKEFENIFPSEKFEIIERTTDDYISKTRSLGLWSEYPFLQKKNIAYKLNVMGKAIAFILNSLSDRILSSGILLVLRKK